MQWSVALSRELADTGCPLLGCSCRALGNVGQAARGAASRAAEPSPRALAATLEQPAAALRGALSAPVFASAADPGLQPREARSLLATVQLQLPPPARQLAAALLHWWRRPEQSAEHALELARPRRPAPVPTRAAPTWRARAAQLPARARAPRDAAPAGPCGALGRRCGGPMAGCSAWICAAATGLHKSCVCSPLARRYCNETCSHAAWRGATSSAAQCRVLGAERAAAEAAAAAQRRQAGGAIGSGGRS